MNIVFFAHPDFLHHRSMPRFVNMVAAGMIKRNHTITMLYPKPLFYKLPFPGGIRKWMGYLDQYFVFPQQFKRQLKNYPFDTLFVFTDNALGPWVPLIGERPHVIHCHDFFAQRSALGEIPENPTSWTGKQYQKMIRRGYVKGKNFISVSRKTREDLHRFLSYVPNISEVVYNGLNFQFSPIEIIEARTKISSETGINLHAGYILHVGGNQWYKNRLGVIEIYSMWRSTNSTRIPLLLIGEKPSQKLLELYIKSDYKSDIYFLERTSDDNVKFAYSGASVFLFPSIAEGFGWPIAEAMACGCPVITTSEAPMTEVGGFAGFYIPAKPSDETRIQEWLTKAAEVVNEVFFLSIEERIRVKDTGLKNAERFNTEEALNEIEIIYKEILKSV